MKNENIYIFTEIINCGKIGRIAIDSFHKYHDNLIHIYGTTEDFKYISPNKNNVFIKINKNILNGYKKGHVGTALLWEEVIKKCPYNTLIHFDSDNIFRDNIVDFMIKKSDRYDLIGPIRNYHHNPQNNIIFSYLADLCQTNCILFKKNRISKRCLLNKPPKSLTNQFLNMSIKKYLKKIKDLFNKIYYLKDNSQMSLFSKMIHGTYNPFDFPTIDFFDPIMFDMIMNGAKIYHLDFNQVGGCDKYGKRDNDFKEINNFPTPYKLDFGSKLAHFSCVGSGMNFYYHKELIKVVGKSYFECAIDRYALFCKIFYDENLSEVNLDKYSDIIKIKEWY